MKNTVQQKAITMLRATYSNPQNTNHVQTLSQEQVQTCILQRARNATCAITVKRTNHMMNLDFVGGFQPAPIGAKQHEVLVINPPPEKMEVQGVQVGPRRLWECMFRTARYKYHLNSPHLNQVGQTWFVQQTPVTA